MRQRRLVALAVLAVAGLVGACGSSTKPSAHAGTTGRVHWQACAPDQGPHGYQCASIAVPLDPVHPGPATINLALDRRPATGNRSGALLVNPGGPGVSAVDALPQIVGMLGATVKTHFDVVGFDPPGVGHSAPLACLDNSALAQYLHADPAPPGPGGINEVVAADRRLGSACRAHSGAILSHVSTADAARDLDLVRQAMGEPTLNYLGFSYGTSLGAVYAQLFGPKVRTMVLDGAIDPSQGALPFLQAQGASLDAQFRRFAAACGAMASCPWRVGGGKGGDLVTAFQELVNRVRQHPIGVGQRSVGPAELLYGTIAGLYSTQSWPVIDQALADAERGDGMLTLAAFDQYVERSANGTYANTFEAESAVNCLDNPSPSVTAIAAAQPGFARADPVFGTLVLYGELSCAVWPVPATSGPQRITAPQAPPIVVIGSTGDPVTPYSQAQSLASQLTHGMLLTRVGDGHTGYGASACVRDAADAYLTDLTIPATGASCPSDAGH
ncbi:MAG: alpha/beta hydrolase [Actinomycetota bacterium]|nr:alpha/beta hydrolase [Actinomycetota bacterium]